MNALTRADLDTSTALSTPEVAAVLEQATARTVTFRDPSQERQFPFDMAAKIVANGWSVYPQERAQDGRKPGKVFGQTIRWKADHDLANKLPDENALRLWQTYCADCNVALVCGPASANIFALDLDIPTEEMAIRIRAIAYKVLGPTPFRRVGNWPKVALFYRTAEGDTVKSTARHITGIDDHLVEIKGAGASMTIWGIHGKTGNYYHWEHDGGVQIEPTSNSPSEAPLVTSAQVADFMCQVDFEFGFENAASAPKFDAIKSGDERGIAVALPRGGAWTVNAEGKVSNGREAYLFSLVSSITGANADEVKAAKASGDEAMKEIGGRIAAAVETVFRATALQDNDWANKVRPFTCDKVHRLLGKVASGDIALRARRIVEPDTADTEAVKKPRKVAPRTENTKPTVQVLAGEITAAVDAAEKHLIASDRGVYQRAGQLVFVGSVPVETRKKKPVTATKILERTEPRLLEDLSAVANWESWDMRAGDWKRVDAPEKVIKTLAARVGDWKLPVLDGVVTAPTLRPDGTVLSKTGFDADTGLLFLDQGVKFPGLETLENPTRSDALAALKKLKHLLSTFPFVDPQDMSAALSGMLTAVVRRSLDKAPMHAYTAPTPGSGKSVLVDLCCILATGREAAVLSQGQKEEEFEKRLSSALMEGDSIITVDNVEMPLGGAFLNQVTTQRFVKPRILGQSKTPEVLCNASFYATGNNLVLYADMVRRALLIALDPRVERPELRQFKNDPIVDAKAQRGELVVAALTVIRAYLVSADAKKHTSVGSYDDWSRFIRAPLMWLGEADPWLTTERAREMDPKLEAMSTIISQWCAVLVSGRFTVAEVIKKATEMMPVEGSNFGREFRFPEFREALLAVAGEAGSINSRRLGKWLLAHAGRIVGGAEICKGGERGGVATWSIGLQGTSTRTSDLDKTAAGRNGARVKEWGSDPKPAQAAAMTRHQASLPDLAARANG